MSNNPNLISEEQASSMEAVESSPVVPGQAPGGAPAPQPHDMPQFFSGSIARQLQLDTAFSGTETASPRVPKHSLMPFGLQASGFTNAAAQSTASKTSVVPTPSVTLFYQEVTDDGSTPLPQRNILNFIGTTVADDGSLASTDVTVNVTLQAPSSLFTLATQTVLANAPLVLALATQSANLFFAGPVTGAAAAPNFRAIDASHDITGVLPVANGGTGDSTLAANELLVGRGTSPVASIPTVSAGYILVDNGPGVDPSFQPPPASSGYNQSIIVDTQVMSDDYWIAVETTGSPQWALPLTVM